MDDTAGRPGTVRVARDALELVEQVELEASRRGADALGVHHWVLVACGHTFLARTIARDADVRAAQAAAKAALEVGTMGPALPPEEVIGAARDAATTRGDPRVRAWHLVLAVLRRIGIATRDAGGPPADPAPPEGAGTPAAPDPDSGGTLTTTDPVAPAAPPEAAPRREPVPRRRVRAQPRPPTPLLDACGTDWTIAAAKGELPPMVGRDPEMRLLIEGLCRPSKPNVMLVGEAGVGKSALVEGLAQRIALGDVPERLANRPLFSLSMAELTRDSRWYGAMEARLAALIAEARAVRAILFIDEGHAMTGSGGREGTGDVASILKPVLARGDLALISATTEDEYRRFIAPNGALERRFTVVHLAEPGRLAVRTMLAAHRDAVAASHRVYVDDEALDRILLRTAGLTPHRREPDRSRDVLDQVVARAAVAGRTTVWAADVEEVVASVSGAPEVDDDVLAALERALTARGLLAAGDAAVLVDRLGTACSGLRLRPRRPLATILVLRTPGGPDGLAIAEAVADGLFGGPEQVIAINVGGMTEPTAVTGFLGTTQGFIGHGVTLPIHALAERPHSVLLLRGVDLAHESLRALVARALRDGHLTDGQARRIGVTQAVVLLEARVPVRGTRPLGFAAAAGGQGRVGPGPGGEGAGSPGSAPAGLGAGAVGGELADECDLVVVPPEDAAPGQGWVASTLGRLAVSYRAAGVELEWDPEVETYLVAEVAAVTTRERERQVESRVGRAVRPCLRDGRRPLRARIRGGAAGLVAETEP
jgi:ATP-dependent Clp protease ATP-binding subunit ClpC